MTVNVHPVLGSPAIQTAPALGASENGSGHSVREPGPHSPAAVIDTHGLTKQYGKRIVVDNLDIAVPSGVVAGLIGPNGAGKTTTLRMLLGLVRPSSGGGDVLGTPLAAAAEYLPRVGALIESPAFYPGLSGERNLAVQATLGGLDPARIPAVLEQVGLTGRGSDRYKTFSLGMKQRLGIAAALLGDPTLLILDEPTNGLDPTGIQEMRVLLRAQKRQGRTVLVSSHLLAELQQVCDWLIVIEHGRRLFQGPTATFLSAGGDELVLSCEHADDVVRLQAILTRRGFPSIRKGDQLRVSLGELATGGVGDEIARLIADINRAAVAEQITLTELTVTRANLEERYLNLVTGGTL